MLLVRGQVCDVERLLNAAHGRSRIADLEVGSAVCQERLHILVLNALPQRHSNTSLRSLQRSLVIAEIQLKVRPIRLDIEPSRVGAWRIAALLHDLERPFKRGNSGLKIAEK